MRSTDPLVHKLGDRWVYRPVDNETIHKRHLYPLRVGHGNVGHQRYENLNRTTRHSYTPMAIGEVTG